MRSQISKPIELTLYRADCNADDVSEGDFRDRDNDYSRQRYGIAMETARRYVDCGWGLVIRGMTGVAKNEGEAKGLIAFCEENITGAGEVIQLSHCCHGRIVFDRKIMFEGWTEERIAELIESLKKSDYQMEHNLSDKLWESHLRPRSTWLF